MTTATGDFAINFAALGNADPYTNANLTLIDTGFNVKILSNVLRPSNGGSGQFDVRRLRYSGSVTGGATLRSKIEIGNAGSGDEILALILDATGAGYGLRINQTAVGIISFTSDYTVSGLLGATAASAANGDVFTLELNQSTHLLTVYLNGVAITGTGEDGLLSVIDSTYTSGLAPGLGFNAQNSSASTIKSWAGDGTASSATGTALPGVGAVTTSGLTPTANAFTNVRIREVLVNEAGSPVANQTGIHLVVWYSGFPSGAADLSYSDMTTDPNGTTSWSLATGTLIYNQRIFYVAHDGHASLSVYTCAQMQPTYS